MQVQCPKCGISNQAPAVFCQGCGTRLKPRHRNPVLWGIAGGVLLIGVMVGGYVLAKLLSNHKTYTVESALNKALEYAKDIRDPYLCSEELSVIAYVQHRVGQVAAAKQTLQQAVDRASHIENPRWRYDELCRLAYVQRHLGFTAESDKLFKRVIDEASTQVKQLEWKEGALTLGAIIYTLLEEGDVQTAIRVAEQNSENIMVPYVTEAIVSKLLAMDNPASAESVLKRLEGDSPFGIPYPIEQEIVEKYAELGDYKQALRVARPWQSSHSDSYYTALLRVATVMWRQGQIDQARQLVNEAVDIANRKSRKPPIANLIMALIEMQQIDSAIEVLDAAYEYGEDRERILSWGTGRGITDWYVTLGDRLLLAAVRRYGIQEAESRLRLYDWDVRRKDASLAYTAGKLAEDGQIDTAITLVEHITDETRRNICVLQIVKVLIQAGEADRALTLFKNVEGQLGELNPSIVYPLVEKMAGIKQFDKAITLADTIKTQKWLNEDGSLCSRTSAYVQIAKSQAKFGYRRRAMQTFRRALRFAAEDDRIVWEASLLDTDNIDERYSYWGRYRRMLVPCSHFIQVAAAQAEVGFIREAVDTLVTSLKDVETCKDEALCKAKAWRWLAMGMAKVTIQQKCDPFEEGEAPLIPGGRV